MTLDQLKIFVAVAERLHMTKAAEAMNVTQSAASAAIAALETQHDIRLFDRVGRGLTLTDAGKIFLPEAKAVLARALAATACLRDLSELRRGELSIAASQTVASYWLPSRLARFTHDYPQVDVKLTVRNTAVVAEAVEEGTAQLGFVEGRVDGAKLDHRRVAVDRIAVYAAPSHAFVGAAVNPEMLLSARWVLREEGSGTRAMFLQSMNDHGADVDRLRIELELPSNEAVLTAVESGPFVTAVSRLAAQPFVDSGRLVELPFELAERSFELLTHRERQFSHAARAFVELL
ncbi:MULTISPECIES: LysR family transcriptional regulator [unclassified Ensifer]|uniref:LysR family transcriptional regulator n=1 Tax=unclassified Ensifer TaxID=2633371 RepID=UPI000712C8E0|nr:MULTISPECIES: LysR family transcriptional regulator [unclassified Ensifer]KQX55128.1 LysR family transcriptional regulator [Ensifer sp. Root1298]KQX90157.1 LysR family transcriptional regulator [Ensifer sp. Root1312]KRC25296.1 LysR family transcriptional regulator [Ensifer sp. Root74]KRD67217.1 LysR family transcriptional regulator [Ensifer sp. Root954]